MKTEDDQKHDIMIEGAAFERFVVKALEAMPLDGQAGLYEVRSIPDYFSTGRFVFVMYGNNITKARMILGAISLRPIVIICLADKVDRIDEEGERASILGAEFVSKLSDSHRFLWWNFVASCKECPEVKLDEKRECVYVDWSPLAAMTLGVRTTLKLSYINHLSDTNIEDFKDSIIQSKMIPSIIIGNGVSIPFGSDRWSQLSDYLFDYLSPKYIDNSDTVQESIGNTNFSLTSMARMMIEDGKYKDALYSCIYRKYEEDMHDNENTLLRAIVRAKEKHKNVELITYNYDEFLERDFQRVTGVKMESVCGAKKDAKTSEPKVKHVHGLIPYKRPRAMKSIVLTQEEYYRAYRGQSWTVLSQKKALNGICLFVGSSLSDLFQMSLINEVKNSAENNKNGKRYLKKWNCYALLCLKNLSDRDIVTVYNYYIKKGIYLIFVRDFKDLPDAFNRLMSY